MARIAFLGTSAFAADLLALLLDRGHDGVLVVSRPDRPAGRGRKLRRPPVAQLATERGLPLRQPEAAEDPDLLRDLDAARADAVVVCAYGQLVREPLLSAHELLNVHPSLLPRWRGAAPVERAIMAGDAETGVAIMRLTAGLDEGPVALQERLAIGPDETFGDLVARLVPLSADLLERVIAERPAFVDQPEDGTTYAEKLGPADREVDPEGDPRRQHDRVRALSPHVGARMRLQDGSWLGVRRTRVAPDGTLELLEVQPAGGRSMPYADYLRGRG